MDGCMDRCMNDAWMDAYMHAWMGHENNEISFKIKYWFPREVGQELELQIPAVKIHQERRVDHCEMYHPRNKQ